MSDFLTTRELAGLLRVKERKVYDMVAAGSLPVRRVTGKLLFPRLEIENWLGAGNGIALQSATPFDQAASRPAIMAGGHDPLLEWALRQSRSGIAAFLDGALDGLSRAEAGECIAAGLHIPEEGGKWNETTVARRLGQGPWVLVEWVRRRRGLLIRPSLATKPLQLKDVRGLRFQARQPEAGSELVLAKLLAEAGMKRQDLNCVKTVARSETDLALAIASDQADVGLGIAAAARPYHLDFVPLIEERFDLLVWRRAWFDPPFQKFLAFCRTEEFRTHAHALGGYDTTRLGEVVYNGP